MRNGAFTLLEIIIVVAIVALAAGIAGWSVQRTHRSVTSKQAIERLIAADQRARTYARRFHQPVELTYHRHALSVELVATEEREADRPWSDLQLPRSIAIDQVQTTGREADAGPNIRIAANGRSRSYVVTVTGPNRSRQWIFFAGLTGETHVLDNLQVVEQLLALSASSRLDPALLEGPDTD